MGSSRLIGVFTEKRLGYDGRGDEEVVAIQQVLKLNRPVNW